MRFPRFLRRFLIGYLILHLLSAGLFVVAVTRVSRTQMIGDAQRQMLVMSRMLLAHLESLPRHIEDPSITAHIAKLGQQTEFRFTVISAEGRVLADSETGTRDIGPHGDRPEVLQAEADGVGFKERFSDTMQMPMMYLAVPVPGRASGEMLGFVRVAAPAVSINESIANIQTSIFSFAIIVSALTALLMLIYSARAMEPLQLFSDSARKIGVGQLDAIPTLHDRDDEWNTLGLAFKQMGAELANREARLTENSRRLEAVLSSMIEGVVAVDRDGVVILANEAACLMLSLTQAELLNRKLVAAVRYPELIDAVNNAQQQRTLSQAEFQTLDEPRRTIKARVSVLSDESQPGAAIVLHDVTDLRALETMRRDFAANVSHELKTPLASIKAYAETLKLGAIHDQQKNIPFVEQIEKQAEVLDHLIQDLLELARIESAKQLLNIYPVQLNGICDECVAEQQPTAAKHQVSLSVVHETKNLVARADGEGVKTIVNNLISNAIHYTPAGGQVTVRLWADAAAAAIEVSDTGIGIAAEHQARIFERFYRVDKARSRDMGSTGLGLAIVKHLTQSFGGSVHLTSKLGKGSSFKIRLPRGDDD